MTFLADLISNKTLIAACIAWLLAQLIKTVIDLVLYGSFNPERMVGSGGMPSSHSSTVCALATTSVLQYGAASFQFSVTFILAMVVMYDAAGVRRETGKQAVVLNRLLRDTPLPWTEDILDQNLKELVGHTPLQVSAGAVLGVAVALFMWFVVYA